MTPAWFQGLTEFQCPSFEDYLKWKEKEEEMTNSFYVQCTGKKAFNMNENEKGKLYHYEIYSIKISVHCMLSILLYLLPRWEGMSKQMGQTKNK